MKQTARVASLVVAGIAGFAAAVSQSAEYRWLNSWDRNLPQLALFAEPYARAIEVASKGSIKLNVSGPEAVPAFEQLQPVDGRVSVSLHARRLPLRHQSAPCDNRSDPERGFATT